MGTILIWCFGIFLMAVGLIGCFVHRVPGPILTFAGLLVIQFWGEKALFSTEAMILCGVAVVVAKILDHFIPKVAAHIHEIHKQGKWGCVIGSLLGLMFISNASDGAGTGMMIVWILLAFGVLPYGAAFLLELTKKNPMGETLMATNAAYATFLMGTAVKLAVCVYCLYTAFTNF